MGKKLRTNQASTKISKDDKKKQQHQLNTMIKILRPKVYITHSSDFKRLVQDLTGNGTTNNSQPPPIIEIIEDEDYQHQHHHRQETTSSNISINDTSDDGTCNANNNSTLLLEELACTMSQETSYNHQFNIYNEDFRSKDLSPVDNSDILLYDSPSEAEIIVPESLNAMFLENDMENRHYFKQAPSYSDDLVSLSPPSSSSSDWQLELMEPFINNNFYDFDDACYNSFNLQKEQALYHQQEVCFFENIELLQW